MRLRYWIKTHSMSTLCRWSDCVNESRLVSKGQTSVCCQTTGPGPPVHQSNRKSICSHRNSFLVHVVWTVSTIHSENNATSITYFNSTIGSDYKLTFLTHLNNTVDLNAIFLTYFNNPVDLNATLLTYFNNTVTVDLNETFLTTTQSI